MTRYARRVDANHAAVRDGLRALGYEVLDLSACGGGVPDLMVKIRAANGMAGIPHLLEVKDGAKPKSAQALTADQEAWHAYAHVITSKVNSLDEAIKALAWAKGRA